MKGNYTWVQAEIEYLKEHYPVERAEDIAEALNKSVSSIEHKASRLKIKKTSEYKKAVYSVSNSGVNSGNFHGYRRKNTKGYIMLYKPGYPSATKDGMIQEHRYIIEQALGFILPKGFCVHHINEDKSDNRLENLAVMTNGAHSALHNKQKKRSIKHE